MLLTWNGRGARTAIHGVRPWNRLPIHAVAGSPSNAEDARLPGVPTNRLDEAKRQPAGIPARRSISGSGAAGLTLAQPSRP